MGICYRFNVRNHEVLLDYVRIQNNFTWFQSRNWAEGLKGEGLRKQRSRDVPAHFPVRFLYLYFLY